MFHLIPTNLNYDFLKMSRPFVWASTVFVLISLVLLYKPGLNYGIDFTGGAEVQLSAPAGWDTGKLREALKGGGMGEAQVIKVERPGSGDDTRAWGPPFVGVGLDGPDDPGTAAYYLAVNRNKRSLRLDLRAPGGAEVLRRLLARADVLVENFRPGITDEMGLGYDDLREMNPDIVYVSNERAAQVVTPLHVRGVPELVVEIAYVQAVDVGVGEVGDDAFFEHAEAIIANTSTMHPPRNDRMSRA